MPPADPHQGGRLEDMAATGTTIRGDAGQQRLISSVPRPDQKDPGPEFSHTNPAHAADNAFDIPRGVEDQGATGEIISGTGDQTNSNIEKKNLDDADNVPQAKGDGRYAKHVRHQKNEFDTQVHAGHDVQRATVEEEELMTQDELLEKRGAK